MEPTESPRGTKRPLPASTAGDEDDDGAERAAPGERKPRFPKGKKAKNRDPGAADADAGGSGEGGAAAEDIDSLMNPELAAVRRARRRHRREAEDTQGAAADVRGFEVRYEGSGSRGSGTSATSPMLDPEREDFHRLMTLVLEAGAHEGSDEHYYASQLFMNPQCRHSFCSMYTNEGRLSWIKRTWERLRDKM